LPTASTSVSSSGGRSAKDSLRAKHSGRNKLGRSTNRSR
jgi:hypothetical protein